MENGGAMTAKITMNPVSVDIIHLAVKYMVH